MQKFEIDENDFGVLAICSIRYCFGRKTYMPSMIQEIIVHNINNLSDRDLVSILRDKDLQDTLDLFGDELIDKPGWERFWNRLEAEIEKRGIVKNE